MKLDCIILNTKIEFLKNYLDHVVKEAYEEVNNIYSRNENGEFEEYGHLENQLNFPFKRIELAARTVYYEINSIFENELQKVAWEPWIKSDKYPGPKTINLPNVSLNEIKSLKMISDLYISQIIKLIEKEYKLKISLLPGAKVLFDLRNKVNAFKHRNDFVDFRKQNYSDQLKISERVKLSEKEARSALVSIKKFCCTLWESKYKSVRDN